MAHKRIQGLLLLLTGLGACTRHDQPGPAYSFSFSNPLPERVNIDVYSSKADYDNNRKAFKLYVNGNSTAQLIVPLLKDSARYWIDWYNNDYTYTNWGMDNPSFIAMTGNAYTVADNADTIKKYTGVVRVVWLDKDKSVTRWKAVDAFRVNTAGYYESVWAILNADQKRTGLMVYKDLSAITYQFANGDSIAQQSICRPVNRGNSARIHIYNNGNLYAESINYSTKSDTIALRFLSDSTMWYKLVR